MPPGMPVAIWASRARTSAWKPSASVTRPAWARRSISWRVASSRSVATRSTATRSGVISGVLTSQLLEGESGIGVLHDPDGVQVDVGGAGEGRARQQDGGPAERDGGAQAVARRPVGGEEAGEGR